MGEYDLLLDEIKDALRRNFRKYSKPELYLDEIVESIDKVLKDYGVDWKLQEES